MIEDSTLRLGIFIGVLVLMMVLEASFPKRERRQKRQGRWTTNLLLVVMNALSLKLLGPITAVVAADYALDHSWGLLTYLPITFPLYIQIILGVVLLDFAVYAQHIASHKIPFFWRFHKVHHVDRDIDVTTGIRFHPLESIMSMIYKCIIILLLGPATAAVVVFEIVLNASAMFNHANVRLPKKIDSILRLVIVTPDVHRIHHSVIPKETDSNYGFFLSIWDRLCRTYIAQPKENHQGMTIGLKSYQTAQPSFLIWCLTLPFKKKFKKTE